jgi:TolA-binding protein
LQRHPDDTRAALAQFVLGRVQSAQGAHRDAARAFAACLAREPSGSLAEDALAELARAHSRAGERAEAVAAAQRYLSSYPRGVHQRAMRELVSEAH